jgi:hypothetical protein
MSCPPWIRQGSRLRRRLLAAHQPRLQVVLADLFGAELDGVRGLGVGGGRVLLRHVGVHAGDLGLRLGGVAVFVTGHSGQPHAGHLALSPEAQRTYRTPFHGITSAHEDLKFIWR